MQRLHLRPRLLPHEPKIVLRLKIDPDLRLRAEDTREPHCHVWSDRCPAVDDCRHMLAGDPERVRRLRDRHAENALLYARSLSRLRCLQRGARQSRRTRCLDYHASGRGPSQCQLHAQSPSVPRLRLELLALLGCLMQQPLGRAAPCSTRVPGEDTSLCQRPGQSVMHAGSIVRLIRKVLPSGKLAAKAPGHRL